MGLDYRGHVLHDVTQRVCVQKQYEQHGSTADCEQRDSQYIDCYNRESKPKHVITF